MIIPVRTPEIQAAYDAHKQASDGSCDFCIIQADSVVETGDTMLVIHNRFPYNRWDNQKVLKHYMIIPKRHLLSLGDQTDKEKVEFVQLLSKYESKGFSVYARSQQNSIRTIIHVHTHLFDLQS